MDIEIMPVQITCTRDVVVDTNVFLHSINPDDDHHHSAFSIIHWLAMGDFQLVLDDTGKSKPNPSTSRLYAEYDELIPAETFPRIVLEALLATGRVAFVERPARALAKEIEKKLVSNKPDRAVAGAACMSQDRTLITNDWDDFTEDVRKWLHKKNQVTCHDSNECV